MSEHDLRVVYHDDVILLAWSMPATYYTRAFVEQCTEGTAVNATCIVHDVTSEVTNGLAVNRLNGTSLSLVVYQDRDEVLRLPFTQEESSKKGSGIQFAILFTFR